MKTITRVRLSDERSQCGHGWRIERPLTSAARMLALALHTNAGHEMRNDKCGRGRQPFVEDEIAFIDDCIESVDDFEAMRRARRSRGANVYHWFERRLAFCSLRTETGLRLERISLIRSIIGVNTKRRPSKEAA